MVDRADGDALAVSDTVGDMVGVIDWVAVFVVDGVAPRDNVAVGVGVSEGADVELKLIVGEAVVPMVEVGVVDDPTVDDGVLVVLIDGVDEAEVPTVAVIVDDTDTVGVTDGEFDKVGSTVAEVLELNVGVDDIDDEVVVVADEVGVFDDVMDGTGDGSTCWRAMNGMKASSAWVSSSKDLSNTSTKVNEFLSLMVLFLRNREATFLRTELFSLLNAEETFSYAWVSSISSDGIDKKRFTLSSCDEITLETESKPLFTLLVERWSREAAAA